MTATPTFFLAYINPICPSFFIKSIFLKFSLLKEILIFALSYCSICLVLSALIYVWKTLRAIFSLQWTFDTRLYTIQHWKFVKRTKLKNLTTYMMGLITLQSSNLPPACTPVRTRLKLPGAMLQSRNPWSEGLKELPFEHYWWWIISVCWLTLAEITYWPCFKRVLVSAAPTHSIRNSSACGVS